MKTILNKILILLSAILAFSSCTEDMNFKDVNITPVDKLYAPDNGKGIQLKSSSSATLFFEWEASKAEDSGSPLYEVLFDKVDGDFSNPLYVVSVGAKSNATISHKDLDRIWSLGGIPMGETGSLIWTIRSSRGLNEALAKESRELTITRLEGFAELPEQLFLVGEGTEAGTNTADAIEFSSPAQGEYEIFTKLTAGKTYQFISSKNADIARSFYIADNKIKEGEELTTVATSGIYRINLDFNLATVTFTEIKKFGLFFCPSNAVIIDLQYAGKGVWTGTGDVEFKQEGWGRDERYKFEMEVVNGGKSETQHWGTKNGTDSRPNASSPDSYYFIKQVSVDQWNDKWKFAEEMDYSKVSVSVFFRAGGDYTHTVTKVN